MRGTSPEERERERAFKASLPATVVTQERIRDEAPTSAADGLRLTAPSLSIQQTTPGQGTIYVRGLSGRAVVYALDGVRLNMAFFRAGNNDYLGLIDPYALSSAIVVPGASSVEYGSDALGGAVLGNTETPSFSEESRWRLQAFQSFSSNPIGTASRVSAAHESKRTAASIGFTYYQAGAIRPGEGMKSPDPSTYIGLERDAGQTYQPVLDRRQLGSEFEFYSTDGNLRQRLGRGLSLLVKAQYSVRPELVRYDQVTPRFKLDLPARAERSLKPMSRAMLSATLEHRRASSIYDSAEVQLAWQRIFERRVDRRFREECIEPLENPPVDPEMCAGKLRLLADGSRSFEDNASNAFTLRAEARKANESKSVSVIAGIDLHHDVVSSRAESLDFVSGTRTAGQARYPDGSTVSEAALFSHLRLRLFPNLHVFAGARGSVFMIDMKGRTGATPSEPFERRVADVVGSVGAHWEFAPGAAWVANAARGVRAPNVEDFAALGTRAQGRFQVPNPDVKPEHSYTGDTGIKLSNGVNRAHAVVFYTRYDDAIALAPTTVGGQRFTAKGDEYYHSVNASSLDLFGAEASFDVALTSNVATFARALVMRGTQKNPAETGLPAETPADRIPPAQGELGVRYLPLPSLELSAFVVTRAAQRRLNDPINLEDNRIPVGGTPGYTTYHARAKYRAATGTTFRLAFDNISNRLALDHGSGFYRAGFSVTASLELGLDRSPTLN